MYYLNDKHPKKEYAIYKRVNNGTPYIAKVFSNLKEVDEFLSVIIRNHEHYNHIYYIDRVGHKNKYPLELAMFYYKLLERPVNDWQEIA